jgi:putative endonuclease
MSSLSYQFGKNCEKLASRYLLKKGYKILDINWYYNKREIDILAIKESKLIIVEVKARSTEYFGKPQEFVNKNKQKLLAEAANAYLEKNNLDLEVQFDIISIIYKEKKFQITHIEDAFRPL